MGATKNERVLLDVAVSSIDSAQERVKQHLVCVYAHANLDAPVDLPKFMRSKHGLDRQIFEGISGTNSSSVEHQASLFANPDENLSS